MLEPAPGTLEDRVGELLERLSNACGIAGGEGEVRELLREALEPHCCEVYTDIIGNLVCRRGNGPVRVMLAAHMDEVGLVVAGHEDSGLLRFKESGGLDPRVLPGRPVLVGLAKMPGVIGLGAVHLLDADDREKVPPSRELLIDIGAGNKEEAVAVAPPGTPVFFSTRFERLSNGRVKGKALDDRVGCAVVAEVLLGPERDGLTLFGVFTVQEEVGLRGARVAAYHVAPRLALAIDGTSSANVPGVDPSLTCTDLSEGPAISVMDGTVVMDSRIREQLASLASRHDVPYQYRRLTTAGTDSGGMFLQREGVPVCSVSVPCRYIHSAASLADLGDVAATIRLTNLFLDSLDKGEFEL